MRLIPACAGKTFIHADCLVYERAHPRVCGENALPTLQGAGRRGSSPRVRGKQSNIRRYGRRLRLIPACAGKTRVFLLSFIDPGAHPRVCGENGTQWVPTLVSLGSSPRVRGKLWRVRKKSCHRVAHPRVCGENGMVLRSAYPYAGSSPRVRGKLKKSGDIFAIGRLIPACAGKTDSALLWESPSRAHPRVCGENFRTLPIRGSRGRLIPACAGKT